MTDPGDREPTNRDILHAIEGLRFDMNQRFAAIDNRISSVKTRLASLEDRFEWLSVTVRAMWDHMNPGGDSSAA